MTKIRVGILFGGRSGEHEVSLSSARSVLRALDAGKYEAVPIGITREGQWLKPDSSDRLLEMSAVHELGHASDGTRINPSYDISRQPGAHSLELQDNPVDVIFPVLHGPHGEDGTVQGMLEIMRIPYVGAEVLASAVSMDKGSMKVHFEACGLKSVPYKIILKHLWTQNRAMIIRELEAELQYPLFVKPCNMGSSVGISKCRDRSELQSAMESASLYDRKIIVEQGIDAREVECGVLGNDFPVVSLPGEVRSHHDFYDYESKYSEGLADLNIPADLSPEQTRRTQDLALRAFKAVDAAGMARVDFFVRRSDGEILVNEINTIPGFTSTSMYPKLWEASGIPYPELIDRLIQLAMERFQEKEARTSFR